MTVGDKMLWLWLSFKIREDSCMHVRAGVTQTCMFKWGQLFGAN